MQINIQLTPEQQKSVVRESLNTLTARDLANELFSKLVHDENFSSDLSRGLYATLANYLKGE